MNQQQLELVDAAAEELNSGDRPEVFRRALREYEQPHDHSEAAAAGVSADARPEGRELLHDELIEPGTGKALEVRRGQILRIEQTEGGQCADFNCFNLHDYKEYLHTGRIRHMHGLQPGKGHFVWSAPPRERPMMAIVEDTSGTNDALYPRCSAFLFEYQYGLDVHTNCHDIQAEAQREYGLTPDDVHDSFNFFMHTGIDQSGRPFIASNVAKAGDYVELLALIDVLAVPNVCGADVMATSNFELKPLRLAIFQGTEEDLGQFANRRELKPYRNQRTPADFKVAEIRRDRELKPDPDYVPKFTNVPLELVEIAVSLDAEERTLLDRFRESDEFGAEHGEVLRAVFHSWWIRRFMHGPKHYNHEAEMTAEGQ